MISLQLLYTFLIIFFSIAIYVRVYPSMPSNGIIMGILVIGSAVGSVISALFVVWQ